MKKTTIFALLFLFLLAGTLSAGDTGTYTIQEYQVKLTPKSDGMAEISYRLKWHVDSGHIPWITVGTPNEDYNILQDKNTGNIKTIKPANSGNWSGVRIDLDKDYRPGETFEVGFTILENRLLSADKDNYKLDFTPGWYDNAKTELLEIEVFFFAKIETVKAKPAANRTEGQSMFWLTSNLGKGKKFEISVTIPKKLFPKEISKDNLKKDMTVTCVIIVIIVIVVVLIIIFLIGLASDDGGYGGGGYVFGAFGRGLGSVAEALSSGGGGGFGGRSGGCAGCGCACACACAGGGGAGCDRKATSRCPLCKDCQKKDKCLIWRGGIA